jgi:protein-disulfide isomerase
LAISRPIITQEARPKIVGREDARVRIIEFADFQCPACRIEAARLDTLVSEHPKLAAVEFHHYPATSHEWALDAAVASECAEDQGRFAAMYRTLFRNADEIGEVAWAKFAYNAGVPDRARFAECVARSSHLDEIIADTLRAAQLNVTQTPTIYIDQIRLPPLASVRTLLVVAIAVALPSEVANRVRDIGRSGRDAPTSERHQ